MVISITRLRAFSLCGGTAARLPLVFLPPYAPQRNPDEQKWGYIKPRAAKQVPENKIELKKLVQSAMHRLQKLPDVVKSFFRHPECRYAGE
jgi:transposase